LRFPSPTTFSSVQSLDRALSRLSRGRWGASHHAIAVYLPPPLRSGRPGLHFPVVTKPPAGAIYIRVSTDEQATLGRASLPLQRAACRELAERDGIPVIVEFEDTKTGRTLDRPGLRDLLADLPRLSHVYALDATRLGRRRGVSQAIRDALAEAGVTLRLVYGDTSGADVEGAVLLESVGDGLAELEVMRLARRTQSGRIARTRKGLHSGTPPYGWRIVRNDKGQSTGAVFDEEARPFYTDLEGLVLSGISWREVGRRMAALGYRSPRTGRPWPTWTLGQLVANPWNRGEARFGFKKRGGLRTVAAPGEVIAAAGHPPLWKDPEAVASELARRAGLKGRARWQRHRLSGLLRCGGCRRRLSGHRNKTSVRYRCPTHHEHLARVRAVDCPAPVNVSEARVVAWLRRTFTTGTRRGVDWMIEAAQAVGAPREPLPDVAAMRRRLRTLERDLARLVDRLPGVPARAVADVHRRLGELADERDNLQGSIRAAEAMKPPPPDREALRDAAATFDRMLAASPAECSSWLQRVFPGGIVLQRVTDARSGKRLVVIMAPWEKWPAYLTGRKAEKWPEGVHEKTPQFLPETDKEQGG